MFTDVMFEKAQMSCLNAASVFSGAKLQRFSGLPYEMIYLFDKFLSFDHFQFVSLGKLNKKVFFFSFNFWTKELALGQTMNSIFTLGKAEAEVVASDFQYIY